MFDRFNKTKRIHLAPQGTLSASRIHLDYAATTPVHKDVLNKMKPYWNEMWANASAIYKEGVKVKEIIYKARENLARTLRVRASDITFTSGGTESNNLALYGVIKSLMKDGADFSDFEIITTRVEHPSILAVVEDLAMKGVDVKYTPIDEEGLIDLIEFDKLLSPKTSIVTFAYINSETGVVQDVKKISRIVRKWNDSQGTSVLVHIDACQAPLWLPCTLDSLNVDLMSLDAGKCYGPKGVGILAHRHNVKILPVILGGKQEGGLRAGTENTALVVGCAEAIIRAQKFHKTRSEKIVSIRDFCIDLLEKEIKGVVINGSQKYRVANNINFSIPGLDSEYAVVVLDAKGIAVSTKSACGSIDETGSYVVREMTKDKDRANSTIRFTLGEESVKGDVRKAVSVLKNHIKHMETLSI